MLNRHLYKSLNYFYGEEINWLSAYWLEKSAFGKAFFKSLESYYSQTFSQYEKYYDN